MTNKELQKLLKQYPGDARVYFVKDWEAVEDGLLTDLKEITEENVTSQVQVIDLGMDFEDETQIILG